MDLEHVQHEDHLQRLNCRVCLCYYVIRVRVYLQRKECQFWTTGQRWNYERQAAILFW